MKWNYFKGTPYPSEEQNAVDIVVQFAIHGLGFKPENIVLFGWSIGGYSSTWAAMNYPEIKGIVCITMKIALYYYQLSAQDFRRYFWWYSSISIAPYAQMDRINNKVIYKGICKLKQLWTTF